MSFARPLIGSGLGAVGGSAAGALSGPREQTKTQRLGRGILGGMAGAVGGGTLHAGLRYRGLKNLGYGNPLEEAILGSKSLKTMRDETEQYKQRLLSYASSNSIPEIKIPEGVPGTTAGASVDFSGKTAQEAKKMWRDLARKFHPDRGGDPAQFDALNKLYTQHLADIAAKGGADKTASIVDSHLFDCFLDELSRLTGAAAPDIDGPYSTVKEASVQALSRLRIPGQIGKKTPAGLVQASKANGVNFGRFTGKPAGTPAVTGMSSSAASPSSTSFSGTTGFVGTPSPPTV